MFPQHPELLGDAGMATPPERRHWTAEQIRRKVRGWLIPYVRSQIMPGVKRPVL